MASSIEHNTEEGSSPKTLPSSLTSPDDQPSSDPQPKIVKPQSTNVVVEPTQPSESWETAYVFAFIYKFTTLCQDLNTGLRLQTVLDLERALESSNIEASNSVSPVQEANSDKCPLDNANAKQLLTDILTTFHDNLKTNTQSWSKWLPSYVEEILKHELKGPANFAVLKWKENYLKASPEGFWGLDWKQKIHLLRILVDNQLTYSSKIRAMIDENYEKAHHKPTKQITTSSTASFQNPLLIKPLGLDRNIKTWWQIDDSHRIYCSGNPYKSNCTWQVLSSTPDEFEALDQSIIGHPSTIASQSSPSTPLSSPPALAPNNGTELGKSSNGKLASIFCRNKPPSSSSSTSNAGMKLECQLRQALEETAKPNIESFKTRVQNLVDEKARVDELQRKRERRLALVASRKLPHLTRDTPGFGVRSRLRSQISKPDYAVDTDDQKFERELLKYQAGHELESKSDRSKNQNRKRKRIRKRPNGHSGDSSEGTEDETWKEASIVGDEDEADDLMEVDEDDSERAFSYGRSSRKRRSTLKKPAAVVQGERRSSRVKLKAETIEEVEVEDVKPIANVVEPVSAAWSRSVATASPRSSEPVEAPSDQPDLNGNVSVWSRGKLVFVAGNNKYASKPVAVAPKKKSIAKAGSGVVVKTAGSVAAAGTTVWSKEVDQNSKSSGSLAGLQARLASMDDDDDDPERNGSGQSPQQIEGKCGAGNGSEDLSNGVNPLASLLFDDVQNLDGK